MQSFIVLGIIPGTNIQTNLNFWIAVTAVLILFACRGQLRAARNSLRTHLAVHKIARTIDHCQFSPAR